MKHLIKNFNIFLSLIALVTISSCSSSSDTTPVVPAVTKLAITLKSGQSATSVAGTAKTVNLATTYTVTATPSGASNAVTWSLNAAYSGATISGTTLTITDAAAEGTIKVKATSTSVKTISTTTDYVLTAAPLPEPTALAIALKTGKSATAPQGTAATVDLTEYYTVTPTPEGANATVAWTVDPAHEGATIEGTTLTITATAAAGTITLKATSTVASAVVGTTEFALEAAAPTSLAIALKTGKSATAPAGTAKTVDLAEYYTVTPTPTTASAAVTWSVDSAYPGATIAETTLSITAAAAVGEITIKATSTADDSKSTTTTYTLTKPAVATIALAVKDGQIATRIIGGSSTVDLTELFEVTVTPSQADSEVTWSLNVAYTGATIAGTTLTFTPSAAATTATTKVVIKATSKATTSKSVTNDFILLATAPAVTGITLSVKDGQIASRVVGAQTINVTEIFDVTAAPLLSSKLVTWTIDGTAPTGVTLTGVGALALTAAAAAGTVTLKATSTTVATASGTAVFTILATAPALTALALVVKDGEKASSPTGTAKTITLSTIFDVNPTPLLSPSAVTWTVDPAYTGATITGTTLAITAAAVAGSFTIKATPNPAVTGVTPATHSYTITPVLTALAVAAKSGQTAAATHGAAKTVDLTELFNVTPTPAGANNEVTWSLNAAYTGATIAGTTLTITAAAAAGAITIKATSTEVTTVDGTATFTLN